MNVIEVYCSLQSSILMSSLVPAAVLYALRSPLPVFRNACVIVSIVNSPLTAAGGVALWPITDGLLGTAFGAWPRLASAARRLGLPLPLIEALSGGEMGPRIGEGERRAAGSGDATLLAPDKSIESRIDP